MNKGAGIADSLALDSGWSRLADFHPMPEIDFKALRTYRLGRIRQHMVKQNVSLCVLSNPLSLRYAADVRQIATFQARVPVMYLAVPAEGPVILFGGFTALEPDPDSVIDEIREGRSLTTFPNGPTEKSDLDLFRNDMRSLIKDSDRSNARVAIENMSPVLTEALLSEGYDVSDAQTILEDARRIKSSDEIECMKWSISVAEHGMAKMQEALQPGIRENQLWALLNYVNVANDGESHDSQQLTSGPRTNPFGREATDRAIEDGDLVAFDTDMIGPYGYCADISRTFHCGPSKPTDEQRDIYKRAHDQLLHNTALIRPGATYEDVRSRGYTPSKGYIAFDLLMHGIGMSDELPFIKTPETHTKAPPDGLIEPGMVLCVEAYAGRENGPDGVKLEEQVLVTDTGIEILTHYPFEQSLLS